MSDDAELLAAAAVALNRHADVLRDLGSLFAEAGHELYLVGGTGARRAAWPAPASRDMDLISPPTPGPRRFSGSCGRGPTRCGTPASSTAPSARQEATTASRSPRSAPTPTTRCHATRRCGSATASTTIWCAATSPSTRWRCGSRPTVRANSSTRWAVWRRCAPACWTPRRAGGVVRRRPAADAAGGAVRLAARLHRRSAGAGGDGCDGGPTRAASPPNGWPPSWTSCCWARTRSPAST